MTLIIFIVISLNNYYTITRIPHQCNCRGDYDINNARVRYFWYDIIEVKYDKYYEN